MYMPSILAFSPEIFIIIFEILLSLFSGLVHSDDLVISNESAEGTGSLAGG
jgi:hypothetical protein